MLLDSFDQLKTITPNKEGLLYGVPVSIKENIGYKVCLYYTWQQEGKYTGRMSKNASKELMFTLFSRCTVCSGLT